MIQTQKSVYGAVSRARNVIRCDLIDRAGVYSSNAAVGFRRTVRDSFYLFQLNFEGVDISIWVQCICDFDIRFSALACN